jgi:Tfp pilus tip-associated adhesin PilY1
VWLFFFGTGQYLNNAIWLPQVQTWYGINDNGATTTATRGDLLGKKDFWLMFRIY